ncbi:MAG: FG-GAP repeat protein [Thermodesulfobacteriota bacterium]
MEKCKHFLSTLRDVIVLGAVLGLLFPPPSYGKKSVAPPLQEGDPSSDHPGQGDEQRADPCEHLPGPRGEAKQFGRALAVGDFDGDNLADLAVGIPFEDVGTKSNAGVVYVLYGSKISSGLPASVQSAQIWHQNIDGIQDGAAASDHFGKALAAGDFNADGQIASAVGVPDEDSTDSTGIVRDDAGAVHIIYGTSSGLNEAGDQFFTQKDLGQGRAVEAGDQFGASLTAWNFGRNETLSTPPFSRTFRTADLAIGILGEDLFNAQGVNLADVGAVSVLYGSSLSNKLVATGNQLWHQTVPGADTPNSDEAGDQIEAGDQFGAALY